METEVSYAKVKKLFPSEVSEIMSKLRKGTSKEKKAKESTLTWSYDWCQQIRCMSFDEMLKSIGQPKPHVSVNQKLKELDKSLLICVKGQKNRWSGFSKRITVIPDEVFNFYKKIYKEQEKEEKELRIYLMNKEKKKYSIQSIPKFNFVICLLLSS